MNLDINKIVNLLKLLTNNEMNDILDYRDSPAFEDEYLANTREFEWINVEFPDSEKVFMELSGASNLHEIVRYIADDLDVISKYESRGCKNQYMEDMIAIYENGGIPGYKDVNK